MRKYLLAAFAVMLLGLPAAVAVEEFSEVEYYQKLAAQKLAEAEATYEPVEVEEPAPAPVQVVQAPKPAPVYYYEEPKPTYYYEPVVCEEPEGPPPNAIIGSVQYFHANNKDTSFKLGGDKMRVGKSRANGMATTLVYNRVFSDWFSTAFMYEFATMAINGGGAGPVPAKEHARYNSHVVGVLPEFNFKEFGKLQLSLIQGFDRAHGNEKLDLGGGFQTRDINNYGTNVTSLMAWYEKDFELGCTGIKLTPYAGWRSLYVVVKNQNNWAGNPGDKLDDSNTWVHLVSAGMKLSFQRGPLGISLRGGVNHRTSKDDIPGYGNRAVAPGVVMFSHRANLDKTVGHVGGSIQYAINKRAIMNLGYDGTFGKKTSNHAGTLSVIFPF